MLISHQTPCSTSSAAEVEGFLRAVVESTILCRVVLKILVIEDDGLHSLIVLGKVYSCSEGTVGGIPGHLVRHIQPGNGQTLSNHLQKEVRI